jgi:hypothetical protein
MAHSQTKEQFPEATPAMRMLATQALSRAAGAPLVRANSISLLMDARENYPAWLAAIGSAHDTIHFENTIICDDDIGRRFVDDVLAELPTKWRRALLLAETDDLPLSAVAEQLDASEEEVKRWIDLGNPYLRARLEEMGLGPTESGPPSPYFVPVAATSTPELEQVFNEITGGENKPAAGGSDRSAAPASSGAA